MSDASPAYVIVSNAGVGWSTVSERIPDAPAVYAWFRSINVSPTSSPTEFVESIMAAVEMPSAPEWRARLGPMHSVKLESRSELSDPKRSQLELLAGDDGFRHHMSKLLHAASILQAPLYVGKAQFLRRRLRQHLEPMSDLALRLRAVGLHLDQCTLAYVLVQPQGEWGVQR